MLQDNLLIYHHLGLGDHIVCNAIVRSRCLLYESVILLCKHHNFESVKAMYSDIRNIKIYSVDNDEVAKSIMRCHIGAILALGYMNPDWSENNGRSFDQQFYRQANLPLFKRWTGFGVMRNEKTESALIKKLYPPKDFIFLHDDAERGYKIDYKKISTLLPVVRPYIGVTKNIIDYIAVMELATEIHCINSSFMLLADSVPLQGEKFVHRYARNEGIISDPVLGCPWTQIN